eukprot:TRINITY_DN76182_c0_g1_i1.p1 TRINITY_DN76182_c0_g1~~TRINITY_DN76182_c0_g1_i1.p1  ORF type:complete len:344 (+),score=46.90 TRINITY_DN76182_c0_g1_i1:32-1033(+)
MLKFGVLLLLLPSCLALSCKGDSDTNVYFYHMLKFPTEHSAMGAEYLYSDSHHESFVKSKHHLSNQATGAVAYTLNQVYDNPTKYGYIFYNDEKPDGKTSGTRAHAKGVLAWDSTGKGFWLVHSCPKFPNPPPGNYDGLPTGEQKFGQHFFCMSLDNVEEVGEILHTIQPNIYAEHALNLNKYPLLSAAYSSNFVNTPTGQNTTIHLQGRHTVTGYFKNRQWGKDLYEDLVAPGIGDSLYVETWCHPCYNSYCSPTYIFDIFKVQQITYGSTSWAVTQDHSKWAVAKERGEICYGDINRASTQRKRGGGTYCVKNAHLASQMMSLISSYGKCN